MKKLSLVLAAILFSAAVFSAESPWEAWKNGYNAYREGERLKLKGDDEAAVRQFAAARKYYVSVQTMRPDWNQKIIAGRIADCDRAISSVTGKTAAPAPAQPQPVQPAASPSGTAAVSRPVADSGEAAKLRSEVALLREELAARTRKLHANAEVVNSLLEDQKLMRGKYALLEKRYKQLQTEAAAPDQKNDELKNALIEAKLNLELAEKRCDIAEDKLKKAAGGLENFEFFRKKAAAELLSAQNRMKLLQSERDSFAEALSKAAEKNAAAVQSAAERDKLIATQAKQLAASREELKKLNAQLDEAISTGAAGGKLQKTLTDDNTKLRSEVAKLREALEKAGQDAADRLPTEKLMAEELTELTSKLKTAVAERDKLKKELAETGRATERDRAALAAATLETRNLREHGAQLDAELKSFAGKNAELTRKLAAFTSADLVSAKSAADRESKLATEIAKLTTALKEEKQASVNAAETVKKLREEMAELAKLEKF
ncbi:MAG: hypothetical protein PHI35_01825, partial [Victivallaceae bacterium]|nr:hypothetical protein [Victivallaceae bacterium]